MPSYPNRRLPVVSDRPPIRERRKRQPPNPFEQKSQRQANPNATELGRVIAFFGPPGAGLSLLLKLIHEESDTTTALVVPDFGPLESQIEGARQHNEVVLVDGFPTNAEGVQHLWDNRFVTPGDGAIIQLRVDPELLLSGQRKQPPPTRQVLTRFNARLAGIEERIRQLDMPYFSVHNDSPEQALWDILARARITR